MYTLIDFFAALIFSFNFITFSSFYSDSFSSLSLGNFFSLIYPVYAALFFLSNSSCVLWETDYFQKGSFLCVGGEDQASFNVGERTMPVLGPPIYHS